MRAIAAIEGMSFATVNFHLKMPARLSTPEPRAGNAHLNEAQADLVYGIS
ncbi:hypothetical protein [Mesorhizobium sp. M0130]